MSQIRGSVGNINRAFNQRMTEDTGQIWCFTSTMISSKGIQNTYVFWMSGTFYCNDNLDPTPWFWLTTGDIDPRTLAFLDRIIPLRMTCRLGLVACAASQTLPLCVIRSEASPYPNKGTSSAFNTRPICLKLNQTRTWAHCYITARLQKCTTFNDISPFSLIKSARTLYAAETRGQQLWKNKPSSPKDYPFYIYAPLGHLA